MTDTPDSAIGRTESAVDLVVPTSVAALAATLDYERRRSRATRFRTCGTGSSSDLSSRSRGSPPTVIR
jgi:hypothetical protein